MIQSRLSARSLAAALCVVGQDSRSGSRIGPLETESSGPGKASLSSHHENENNRADDIEKS